MWMGVQADGHGVSIVTSGPPSEVKSEKNIRKSKSLTKIEHRQASKAQEAAKLLPKSSNGTRKRLTNMMHYHN